MPQEYARIDRISDAIRKELAVLIRQSVRDPRIGMVNINDVELSKDYSSCKVYIGFIGFTRLCSGFMSGSISVLLVLHACQQNQPGCCRGGRSGQSLILCLTYRCVHPAQKLYENIMFLSKTLLCKIHLTKFSFPKSI